MSQVLDFVTEEETLLNLKFNVSFLKKPKDVFQVIKVRLIVRLKYDYVV